MVDLAFQSGGSLWAELGIPNGHKWPPGKDLPTPSQIWFATTKFTKPVTLNEQGLVTVRILQIKLWFFFRSRC